MKNKISTFCLMLIFASSALIIKGQNQVSKAGFFKSLSADPVITLYNSSNSAVECIKINYKVNGGEMQTYNFGGTLPAKTSVDIPLPRIRISGGMLFFDASVTALNGESLKGRTFAEGISLTISPGPGTISKKDIKKDKSGCDCENGEGLDEDISFWTNVYIDDQNKLDAFSSVDHGKLWYKGKWDKISGLENEWNTAEFNDPSNRFRSYHLNISTNEIPENITYYDFADNEITGYEIDDFTCKAYPNPFSDQVNIEYTVSQKGNVDIIISDLSGKLISQPVKSVTHGKGQYTYKYNTSKLVRGVYYCTVSQGNKKHTLKLVKK